MTLNLIYLIAKDLKTMNLNLSPSGSKAVQVHANTNNL